VFGLRRLIFQQDSIRRPTERAHTTFQRSLFYTVASCCDAFNARWDRSWSHYCRFSRNCVSKRMLKIGQYLTNQSNKAHLYSTIIMSRTNQKRESLLYLISRCIYSSCCVLEFISAPCNVLGGSYFDKIVNF